MIRSCGIGSGPIRWRGLLSLALALVVTVIGAPVGWAQGAGQSSEQDYLINDEVAVAELDPAGLPVRSYLISRISSRGGQERTVVDPTATANIGYLNQRGRPVEVAGGIEVTVGGPQARVTLTRALFDKPMPVAVHAEYRLDGDVVEAAEVLGHRGDVGVSYTVTNTDVRQTDIVYTDAQGRTVTRNLPVFAPLVGTLRVTLPVELILTDPGTAAVSTDDRGRTVLSYSIVVYPPLGGFQQTVGFSATTDGGSIPGMSLTMMPSRSEQDPAVAFSDDLLVSAAEGNEELLSGLRELDRQTGELARGTSELAAGLRELADATDTAGRGYADGAVPAARQLADGAEQIARGQADLLRALAVAAGGARSLEEGAAVVADGVAGLSDGARQLADPALTGASQASRILLDAAEQIASAIGSPTDPPLPTPTLRPTGTPTPKPIPTLSGTPVLPTPTLPPGITPTLLQTLEATLLISRLLLDSLVTLNNDLLPVLADLTGSAATAGVAAADAGSAAAALTPLVSSLCDPPLNPPSPAQCAAMAGATDDAAAAATGAGEVAADVQQAVVDLAGQSVRTYLTAGGQFALTILLDRTVVGVRQLAAAIRSGSTTPGEEGLVEGLALLESGLTEILAAAEMLADGADLLAEGSREVSGGVSDLAAGLGDGRSGAEALAAGGDRLAAGAERNAQATQEVAEGLLELAAGTGLAADGAAAVASGTDRLQQEGTAEAIRAVADGAGDPALAAAYLAAANQRAGDALAYGPPAGGVGTMSYVLTMDPVEPSDSQWWLLAAVVLLVIVAMGGAMLNRLRTPQ